MSLNSPRYKACFNRTFMELKSVLHGRIQQILLFQSYLYGIEMNDGEHLEDEVMVVSIVPLWN